MLKIVETHQLRLGMYVHSLSGSWFDHNFWRKSFLIVNHGDIEQLSADLNTKITIDTSKGLDVEQETATLTETVLPHQALPAVKKMSLPQEYEEQEKAAKLIEFARPAMMLMFEEARMGKAVDVKSVMPLVDDVTASIARNPGTLISLLRLKTSDDYTYMHSLAVCALMVGLSNELSLSADITLQAGLAGLLHDIGKSALSAAVLQKAGPLTELEFSHVRTHPRAGHALLKNSADIGEIPLDVVLHHHEKVDGSGYPDGLNDTEISLYSKMAAVCDVYDAITSNRPYKAGWEPSESIKKMASWRENHFDDRIFRAFVKMIGIYPVGSVVKTNSEKLGIVVEHNRDALLRPKIKLFYCLNTKSNIAPEILDLNLPDATEIIISSERSSRLDAH